MVTVRVAGPADVPALTALLLAGLPQSPQVRVPINPAHIGAMLAEYVGRDEVGCWVGETTAGALVGLGFRNRLCLRFRH